MSLMRYQPNQWLREIEKEIYPFMTDWFSHESANALKNWVPRVDLKEDKDQYLVFVDLPGVDPKDIHIEMDGHTLTISGERNTQREENKENFYRIERASGKFCRQFSLPDSVDGNQIQAKTKQGVLTILLPKLKAQQSKKIAIQADE